MAFISHQDTNGYVSRCLSYKENYRAELDKSPEEYTPAERYFGSELLSFVFDKAEVLELLDGPGVTSLRVYYGADQTGDPTIVLVRAEVVDETTVNNLKISSIKAAVETPIPPTTGSRGKGINGFDFMEDNVG